MTVDDWRRWLEILAEDIALAELRLSLLSPESASDRLREQTHIVNRKNFSRTIQAALNAAESVTA